MALARFQNEDALAQTPGLWARRSEASGAEQPLGNTQEHRAKAHGPVGLSMPSQGRAKGPAPSRPGVAPGCGRWGGQRHCYEDTGVLRAHLLWPRLCSDCVSNLRPLLKNIGNGWGRSATPRKSAIFFEGFTRWIVKERAAGDASLGGGCVVWANQTKKRLLL